jgi:hypothetical protein
MAPAGLGMLNISFPEQEPNARVVSSPKSKSLIVLHCPKRGDVLLRNQAQGELELVDAVTLAPIQAQLPNMVAAVESERKQ